MPINGESLQTFEPTSSGGGDGLRRDAMPPSMLDPDINRPDGDFGPREAAQGPREAAQPKEGTPPTGPQTTNRKVTHERPSSRAGARALDPGQLTPGEKRAYRQIVGLQPEGKSENEAPSQRMEQAPGTQADTAAAFVTCDDEPDTNDPVTQELKAKITSAGTTLQGGVRAVAAVFNKANEFADTIEAAAENYIKSHQRLNAAREKYLEFKNTGVGKVITMGAGFAVSGALGPAATAFHALKAVRSTRKFMLKNGLSMQDLFSRQGLEGLVTGAGTSVFTRYILPELVPGPVMSLAAQLATSFVIDAGVGIKNNYKEMRPAQKKLAKAWTQARQQTDAVQNTLTEKNFISVTREPETGQQTETINYEKLFLKFDEDKLAYKLFAEETFSVLQSKLDAQELRDLQATYNKSPQDFLQSLKNLKADTLVVQALTLHELKTTGFDTTKLEKGYEDLGVATRNLVKASAGNMFGKAAIATGAALGIAITNLRPLQVKGAPQSESGQPAESQVNSASSEPSSSTITTEQATEVLNTANPPDSITTTITDQFDPDGKFDAELYQVTGDNFWAKLDLDQDGTNDLFVKIDTTGTDPTIDTNTDPIALSEIGAARLLWIEKGFNIRDIGNMKIVKTAESQTDGIQFVSAVADPNNDGQALGIVIDNQDGTFDTLTPREVFAQIPTDNLVGKDVGVGDGNRKITKVISSGTQTIMLITQEEGENVVHLKSSVVVDLQNGPQNHETEVMYSLDKGAVFTHVVKKVPQKPAWDTRPKTNAQPFFNSNDAGFYGMKIDTLETQAAELMEDLDQEAKNWIAANLSALDASDTDEDGMVEFLFDGSGGQGPQAKAQALLAHEFLREGYGNANDPAGELKLLLGLRKAMADLIGGKIEINGQVIRPEDVDSTNVGEVFKHVDSEMEGQGIKTDRTVTPFWQPYSIDLMDISGTPGDVPTTTPSSWVDLTSTPTATPPVTPPITATPPATNTLTPPPTGTPAAPTMTATVPPTATPETGGSTPEDYAEKVLKTLFGINHTTVDQSTIDAVPGIEVFDANKDGTTTYQETENALIADAQNLPQAIELKLNKLKGMFSKLFGIDDPVDVNMDGKEDIFDAALLLRAGSSEGVTFGSDPITEDTSFQQAISGVISSEVKDHSPFRDSLVKIFFENYRIGDLGQAVENVFDHLGIDATMLSKWGIKGSEENSIDTGDYAELTENLSVLGWNLSPNDIEKGIEPWKQQIAKFWNENGFVESLERFVKDLGPQDKLPLIEAGLLDANGSINANNFDPDNIYLEELAALKAVMEAEGLAFKPGVFVRKIVLGDEKFFASLSKTITREPEIGQAKRKMGRRGIAVGTIATVAGLVYFFLRRSNRGGMAKRAQQGMATSGTSGASGASGASGTSGTSGATTPEPVDAGGADSM